MNKVIEKTTCCPALAFALFVTVALAMPGPGPINLSAAIHSRPVSQSNASVGCGAQIPATLLSDRAQKNMATNGKPGHARPAYLALPPILKPNNTDKRFNKQTVSYKRTTISSIRQNRPCDVLTSTSLISSNLGRRVTLVGAKPSGTS
jgi:H+/gluconate symporter-like permease